MIFSSSVLFGLQKIPKKKLWEIEREKDPMKTERNSINKHKSRFISEKKKETNPSLCLPFWIHSMQPDYNVYYKLRPRRHTNTLTTLWICLYSVLFFFSSFFGTHAKKEPDWRFFFILFSLCAATFLCVRAEWSKTQFNSQTTSYIKKSKPSITLPR